MGKKGRIRHPSQKTSPIKAVLEKSGSVTSMQSDGYFKLSFRHFDRNQGQSYFDWEDRRMLGKAIDTLANHCCGSLVSQLGSKKFASYGAFPPPDKTSFTHPKHIPLDVEWARIHVDGKHCIIGHILNETFYVVFLDAEHQFWKSEKKGT